MTFPMPTFAPLGFASTLIPHTEGAIVHTGWLVNGTYTAAFDNTINQARTASAETNGAATPGYNNGLGKDWGAGGRKLISRFTVWGPNNANIHGSSGGTNMKLQGSHDGSSWFDLTSPIAFPTGSAQSVDTATGINIATFYRYHRVNFEGIGPTNALIVAEVRFYEYL